MSDVYTEILVSKKKTIWDIFVRVFLIVATAASIAAGVIIRPIFLIAAAVCLILDFLVLPRLNVEYEYLYVNGELDIDKIFSMSRRKRAASYQMCQMEMIAPMGSSHLKEYMGKPGIRTINVSSGKPDACVYEMIISKDQRLERILLEPNEIMLKDLRTKMPRKVFAD